MGRLLKGRGYSEGLALAEVLIYSRELPPVPQDPASDPEDDVRRLGEILDKGAKELESLYEDAVGRMGEAQAEIFLAHQTILEDDYSIREPIEALIREEKVNTAAAIDRQFRELAEMFRSMDDELMSERAADFDDIRQMLLRIALSSTVQDISKLDKDAIIAAEELTPSDTVRMDMAHIKGIATRLGGPTAHSAIIARSLGIPYVSGIDAAAEGGLEGHPAILNGTEGWLLVDPDEDEVCRFKESRAEMEAQMKDLADYIHKPSQTADGRSLEICANIGTPAEAAEAVSAGADGIGLFRSEFLFMDRDDLPSEEEQYLAYRKALAALEGRPLIVRTLDIGGDKKLPALPMPQEDNPFLGLRAIRLTMANPALFRTQLRALLRASAEGDLRIMFPMISSPEELTSAKAILNEEKAALAAEGLSVDPPVGMMSEVPSAAVLADVFAREVDFFSIGTNDLTQYTLAVERNNAAVADLYRPDHPAVLRLIAMTAQAAVRAGIPCGMCGESAGDPALAPAFVGMGVTELSMSPKRITAVRKLLSSLTWEECRDMAEALIGAKGCLL